MDISPSQRGPLHGPCSGSLGPWRMWPRATGQQQGPLSSLVADGVSPGPSGQGRGHDLSHSQEVLPRPWAQPAWCVGSADGVLRGQAGPLGTCLRVQGSRFISKPFVPRSPPGGPLPLQPSGNTNTSQWGAHPRPSSPHLQTWRSSEPGGCAPHLPHFTPTPIRSLPGPSAGHGHGR